MVLKVRDIKSWRVILQAKVCAQWRILKPPGSLLATDRSKAVVLV